GWDRVFRDAGQGRRHLALFQRLDFRVVGFPQRWPGTVLLPPPAGQKRPQSEHAVHEPLLPQPFPQAFHGPGSLVQSRVAKTSGDFLLLYFLTDLWFARGLAKDRLEKDGIGRFTPCQTKKRKLFVKFYSSFSAALARQWSCPDFGWACADVKKTFHEAI